MVETKYLEGLTNENNPLKNIICEEQFSATFSTQYCIFTEPEW